MKQGRKRMQKSNVKSRVKENTTQRRIAKFMLPSRGEGRIIGVRSMGVMTFMFLAFIFSLLLSLSDVSNAKSPRNAKGTGISKSLSLDDLLKEIKSEQRTQSAENQKREKEFLKKKSQQQSLLTQARAELKRQESITELLTQEFQKNEKDLTKLEHELNLTLGTMGELFGVVRQVSGDLKGIFQTSVVSAELPGREAFVGRLAETKVLPEIKDLEQLWFEMQREMTKAGEVSQFQRDVILPNGEKQNRTVTRVGSFNLISESSYLVHQHETGQITELSRQPSSRFTSLLEGASSPRNYYAAFAIDPSRGAILSMLVQAPNFLERIQQGGIVGYVILFLLAIGIILTWERIAYLKREDDNIKQQFKNSTPNKNNALGRVMNVFYEHKNMNLDALELKMDEAIIRNTSPIERGVGTIKILATVAPLLGLLGTVTGMIATFQSITLFGTGDPKLMAGGISQALITTVLGLVCAIPLLLLHNLVASKSRRIVQILEEQCVGLLADQEACKAKNQKNQVQTQAQEEGGVAEPAATSP